MKLWILRPVSDKPDWWDCAQGFVIRAESESQARQMIVDGDKFGDEGHKFWLDSKQSSCVELIADGDPQIILRDFAYG